MKKQLLLLIAACLLSSSGFACEEGRPQAVRLLSDEAQQIHVFTKYWQIIHPLDGAPLQEFAVTDLDGNGLLEILSRTREHRSSTRSRRRAMGCSQKVSSGIIAMPCGSTSPGSQCILKRPQLPGLAVQTPSR